MECTSFQLKGAVEASVSSTDCRKPYVLIVGAGITGLVLAQALKKHNIEFAIYETDPDASARGRGWGLTIHWSLDAFISILPRYVVDRLPETYVNPEASKRGENGRILFFDLRSSVAKWKVPPSERIRVSRERLRALLLEGLDVQWSKSFVAVTSSSKDAITAHFADTTTATGTLVVGADGSHSRVRSALLSHTPDLSRNKILPIRLLGATVVYPSSLALKLRALDPFFFQGGDPQSSTFMYFSFLDTPSNNTRSDRLNTYELQIILSWPYRRGFMDWNEPLDVPPTSKEKVALMKTMAKGWAEPIQEMVMSIPEDADPKAVAVEDFLPKQRMWDNMGGRITLVGDAAHTMTMYRGEGANHGITDVSLLLDKILLPIQSTSAALPEESTATVALQDAINNYEQEMIERGGPAVLTSHRACLDAHDYKKITDQSHLISKRVMVTKE